MADCVHEWQRYWSNSIPAFPIGFFCCKCLEVKLDSVEVAESA